VTLNGKTLAAVWHAPYRVDLTGEIKDGREPSCASQ
jgi:hypothetical protein